MASFPSRELETALLAALLERRFASPSGTGEHRDGGRVAWTLLHEGMAPLPDPESPALDGGDDGQGGDGNPEGVMPDLETWGYFVARGEALLRGAGIPKSVLTFTSRASTQ